MKILVLSPHRGDAAFSLSIAITMWLAADHTVTCLNVFTRSLQAPFSDAEFVHENDRMSYVSAMRLREDEQFVQRLAQELPRSRKTNIQRIDLNLKDAPIRLRCSVDDAGKVPVNPDDPAIEKIRKAVKKQAETGAMDALVLPLGVGGHVDHLTVREAALNLVPGLPEAFYEDFPYATDDAGTLTGTAALAEQIGARLQEKLTPVLSQTSSAEEVKNRLITLYASQIDSEVARRMAAYAAPFQGGERLWANDAWLRVSAGSIM